MTDKDDDRNARLKRLLDTYGADAARWPEDERARAETLVEADPQARALRAEAARLDAALDRATLAEPSSELIADVLTAAPVTPWRRRLIALWPFGPAWQPTSALATACVLGIVAGLATGGAETLDANTLGDEIGLLALGPQYQLPTYKMEDAP